MFIAMNRFRIAPGREETFETLWRQRESYLDEVPGFKEFHLLRGPTDETQTLYASHSVWESREAFTAWTESEAFKKAHAQARAPQGHVPRSSRVRGVRGRAVGELLARDRRHDRDGRLARLHLVDRAARFAHPAACDLAVEAYRGLAATGLHTALDVGEARAGEVAHRARGRQILVAVKQATTANSARRQDEHHDGREGEWISRVDKTHLRWLKLAPGFSAGQSPGWVS